LAARGRPATARLDWRTALISLTLAKGYFGSYVESLSPLAVTQWLRQAAADLNGQYRVVFESEQGPEGVLKVSLKRKDAKLRVGRTETQIPGSN